MYMLRFLIHDTKKCVSRVYVLVLSATDQAKAVEELTQHVREMTSEVSEQGVGKTTRRRNDRTLPSLGQWGKGELNHLICLHIYHSLIQTNLTEPDVELFMNLTR